jgi:hypothetical protein
MRVSGSSLPGYSCRDTCHVIIGSSVPPYRRPRRRARPTAALPRALCASAHFRSPRQRACALVVLARAQVFSGSARLLLLSRRLNVCLSADALCVDVHRWSQQGRTKGRSGRKPLGSVDFPNHTLGLAWYTLRTARPVSQFSALRSLYEATTVAVQQIRDAHIPHLLRSDQGGVMEAPSLVALHHHLTRSSTTTHLPTRRQTERLPARHQPDTAHHPARRCSTAARRRLRIHF